MTALEAIRELLARLSTARSAEDIGRSLMTASAAFGLTEVLIVDLGKTFSAVGPAIVFASGSREDIDAADVCEPFMLNATAAHARASEQPLAISHARPKFMVVGGVDQSPRMPPHLSHSQGLIVPVHEGGVARWYVAFAGENPDLSERAQSVVAATVHAAFECFNALETKAPRGALTRREWECLQWVAHGKTDFEVGKILDISPRTVRFHIDNAKVKLGVATRIQAVAKRLAGAV